MPRIAPVDPINDSPERKAGLAKIEEAWGTSWNVTSTIAVAPTIIAE